MKISACLVAGAVVLLAGAAAMADTTVTLYATADGGYGNGDTGTGSTNKYGYSAVDLRWGGDRRMIVRWDLSEIPAGATITAAQANVYAWDYTFNGVPFSCYKVTSDWTEGHGMSNGSYPQNMIDLGISPDGCNWKYRQIETLTEWSTPGGDIDLASRIQFTGALVYDPENADYFGMQPNGPGMISIVQSWVDSGTSYGLIFKSDETSGDIRHSVMTRDYGYPDNGQDRPAPGIFAPQLVISYTMTPQTGGLTVKEFFDCYRDGTFDGADKMLAGQSVTVTGAGGYSNTTTTDENGEIALTGLAAGEYTISRSLLSAHAATTTDPLIVTVTAGNTTTAWVGDVMAADINQDGLVDSQDFTQLKAMYGQSGKTWTDGDVAGGAGYLGDGVVDSQDFTALKAAYGQGALYNPAAIPEPATLTVLTLAGLAVLRKRSR